MSGKVRLMLMMLLCGGLSAGQNAGVQARLADAIAAAKGVFPAPGASWTAVEQRFWPNHIVVKLSRAADERWYHRPTVAVDALGNAYVLTQGVVRISQDRIIKDFNSIARAERVALTEDELDDYASFFLSTHVINSDHHCLQTAPPEREEVVGADAVLPEDVCLKDRRFTLLRTNGGIQLETVLVHRKDHWFRPYTFLLGRDGTIERIVR